MRTKPLPETFAYWIDIGKKVFHVVAVNREGALCEISEKESSRRWQLLKGWLSDLYPDEYRVETNQEILIRGRAL